MYELGSLFSLNSCCLQQPSPMCQSNFLLLLLLQNEFVYYFPFTNRSRCHLLLQICKVTISQMHCSSSGGEARSMVAIISLSPLRESMQGFQSKVQPSLLHKHATNMPVHITLALHVNCRSFRGLETRTPIPYSICTKDFEWVTS